MKWILAALVCITGSLTGQSTGWVLDRANSSVSFAVNHMMISEVNGEFTDFFASFMFDEEQVEGTSFVLSVSVASVDTRLNQRDDHLRSKEFFDVENFPKMRFAAKKVQKVEGKNYRVTGDLTIKDVTKRVTVDMVYGGLVKDYWGNKRIGLQLTGEINRFEFGLNWNELLEAGGLIMGEKVKLKVNLEVFQQKGAFDLAHATLKD